MVEPGHVYECCGKVGRISRHHPWCPSRAPTTPVPLDLDAIRRDFLKQCGPHDYGVMETGCNCPEGEPRWAISRLADEVEALRDQRERRRVELVAAHNDLLDIRGILSPNGYPPVVPMELGETVAPAVRWLVDEVERLREAESLTDQLGDMRATMSAAEAERDDYAARLRATDGAYRQQCEKLCTAEAEVQRLRAPLGELVALKDGPRDADYEHRKPAAWESARRALDGDGQLQPRTRVLDDLREKIIEILDGYFRYTLELRLDEDIPAAADDLTALVDASYESAAGGTS